MSIFAVLLIAVGAADLARSAVEQRAPRSDGGARRVHRVGTEVGILTVWLVAALAGLLTTPAGWLLAALATLSVAAWVLASRWALTRERGHVAALSTLAVGLSLQVALAGWAPDPGGALARWIEWSGLPWAPEPGRALLVSGLVLIQLSTANLIVRLVLISTGALSPTPRVGDAEPEELKGGRLLGPLERLFILGLGLAGEVTAAGLVIAAKGLIRWPELRSHSRPESGTSDIDKVTEYFLVGSFVSWLVALSALVLAA